MRHSLVPPLGEASRERRQRLAVDRATRQFQARPELQTPSFDAEETAQLAECAEVGWSSGVDLESGMHDVPPSVAPTPQPQGLGEQAL